ncbi:amino-terminal domain cyclin [Medicago truncatula]|uniref:B-like cyclin n=1 Tax=Medicago truncatula TaxID=3880 RepID=G7INA5_MEDTR|nr:amino-terminal domain cyclin [Medicago truncatula]
MYAFMFLAGRDKRKQKAERGGHQVIGDSGNLEGNQISRPITRFCNFLFAIKFLVVLFLQGKKQLTKFEMNGPLRLQNLVPELEVPANYDEGVISRQLLFEPKDQTVNMGADDTINNMAKAEYLDKLHQLYKLTTKRSIPHPDFSCLFAGSLTFEPENHDVDMETEDAINNLNVDWLVKVHYRLELQTEALFLTINIIDRYLSLTSIPKRDLMLVAICSMSLADKYKEISYRKVV